MKKLVAGHGALLAILLVSGSAFAEGSVPPVSEMPLDQGIVIDVSGGEAAVTGIVETTEDAAANDGSVLPLDQGDINASEIDAGGQAVEVGTTQAEVVAPEADTVVLTETKAVVEKLPKTGIADQGILYASIASLLGIAALVFTRTRKAEQV